MPKKINKIGRYEIEEHLGAGAHADVYRAADPLLKRKVALKVLKPALIADEDAFARFTREAQVLANLPHPHIAWVWDMGEADGSYYLAMRYVEGKSLDKVIAERGALAWTEALQAVQQVADGLQFAHDKGLVHRDIKPQNIIISQADGAVLTDFGLVRAIVSSGGTSTGAMLGTPHYMAPEVWEIEESNSASDQYALACVLVEMLTGKILFDGKTPPIVMAKHFRPLELPASLGRGVPAGVENILRKALAHKPADRYASVKEFTAALATSQMISTETMTPPSPPPPIKWAWWPWMVGGIGLALAVMIFNNPNPIAPAATQTPPSSATQMQAPTQAPAATTTKAPVVDSTTSIPTPVLGIGSTLAGVDGMTLLYVPASEFTMGSDNGNENPIHQVKLDSYWIDQTEVTNEQYAICVSGNKCTAPSNNIYIENPAFDTFPVVYVNWNQARIYCEWAERRLPTEAEWEKAARGTEGRTYPWGNVIPSDNNMNSQGIIEEVGKYPNGVSPYGALDLAGNAWEWVNSVYMPYPYNSTDGRDSMDSEGTRVIST